MIDWLLAKLRQPEPAYPTQSTHNGAAFESDQYPAEARSAPGRRRCPTCNVEEGDLHVPNCPEIRHVPNPCPRENWEHTGSPGCECQLCWPPAVVIRDETPEGLEQLAQRIERGEFPIASPQGGALVFSSVEVAQSFHAILAQRAAPTLLRLLGGERGQRVLDEIEELRDPGCEPSYVPPHRSGLW